MAWLIKRPRRYIGLKLCSSLSWEETQGQQQEVDSELITRGKSSGNWPGNNYHVVAGTKRVAGHSCGGRYGVDKNVWDPKLADTRGGGDSDDEGGRATVDRSGLVWTIKDTTGDNEGTAGGNSSCLMIKPARSNWMKLTRHLVLPKAKPAMTNQLEDYQTTINPCHPKQTDYYSLAMALK